MIMKTKFTLLVTLILIFNIINFASAQKKYSFEAQPNKIMQYSGDLSEGSVITDLSWAWKSSVACFPGTEKEYFTGNQVMWVTTMPAYSEMDVTVIPEDENDNMSIYGYQTGVNDNSFPPELSSCVSCESERKWEYPKAGRTQDHTRTIHFVSVQNSYRLVIAVVGANGLQTGKYKLQVDLKTKVDNSSLQEEVVPTPITAEANQTTEVTGNLEDGVFIYDLSWASRSSTACWPATQDKKFTGKHVLYTTEIPKYSEMTITVVPDDKKANFSIYAYEVGINNTSLPPDLTSCVSCEAEHKWDYPKKGKTQDHTRSVRLNAVNNPYKVVIGVCGADKLESGAYTLKIEIKK